MNRFLISFTLILFITCFAHSTDIVTIDLDKSGWTKPALEGQWKFVTATKVESTPFLNKNPDPQIFPDEAPLAEPPYIGPDLIFENDSVYELK